MKRYSRLKAFLLGVVISAIITTTIVPTIANQIQIFYNTVNIAVNGQRVVAIDDDFTLPSGMVVPYSINYRGTVYLPMREMGRLVGFEVDWDPETSTVHVSTAGLQPAEEPEEEDEEETQAPQTPANTNEFEMVPAASLQARFNNRENFAMVLFDSNRPAHEAYVTEIRRVARAARVKLYAVDAAALPTATIQPEFARTSVPTRANLSRPAVFYVLGINRVIVDAMPTNTARLERDFAYFRENYRPATGSGIGGAGGAFGITPNVNMRELNFTGLQRKIDDRDSFMLIYYSSLDSFSYFLMTEVVYEAVDNANRRVYIIDGAEMVNGIRLQDNWGHWINDNHTTVPQFPVVFFIRNGEVSPTGHSPMVQPGSANALETRIRDFWDYITD